MKRRSRKTHLDQVHVGHDGLDLPNDLCLCARVERLELYREQGLLCRLLLQRTAEEGQVSSVSGAPTGQSSTKTHFRLGLSSRGGRGRRSGSSCGHGNLGDVELFLLVRDRNAKNEERCEKEARRERFNLSAGASECNKQTAQSRHTFRAETRSAASSRVNVEIESTMASILGAAAAGATSERANVLVLVVRARNARSKMLVSTSAYLR